MPLEFHQGCESIGFFQNCSERASVRVLVTFFECVILCHFSTWFYSSYTLRLCKYFMGQFIKIIHFLSNLFFIFLALVASFIFRIFFNLRNVPKKWLQKVFQRSLGNSFVCYKNTAFELFANTLSPFQKCEIDCVFLHFYPSRQNRQFFSRFLSSPPHYQWKKYRYRVVSSAF